MKPAFFIALVLQSLIGFSQSGQVTILFDAFGKDTALQKGWGYSALIKYGDKTILFDAGSNADVFASNASKLNIDLKKIDAVVVSHTHHDHVNGLDYLLTINPNVKIYFPADVFWGAPSVFDATGTDSVSKDSLPVHMQYFDGGKTRFTIEQAGGRFWKRNIVFVKNPVEIFPGARLVVTSAGHMGYFSKYPSATSEQPETRLNGLVELSLQLTTTNGLALFSGCSHSGIENIVTEVRKQTSQPISIVFGGFHLLPFNKQQLITLAATLKNEFKVQKVAPGHCSGHAAFKVFSDLFGKNYVYAGLGETIRF